MRPLCECGNLAKKNGLTVDGRQKYYKKCSSCLKKRNKQGTPGNQGGQSRRNSSLKHLKKAFCEVCGFKAVHSCQLDLDHIDGDYKNNTITNIQTLCACCHRLKSWSNKDFVEIALRE